MQLDTTQRRKLGEAMREHMKTHDLSISKFATDSGFGYDPVKRFADGGCKIIQKTSIDKLEKALGKSFADIIGPPSGGNGRKHPKPKKLKRDKQPERISAEPAMQSLFTIICGGTEILIPSGQRITVLGPRAIKIDDRA